MKTIAEIRKENLAAVIKSHWGGKASRLAAKLNCEKTTLSRIFSTTKTRRDMGGPLARRIEKASGLDSGWMDTPHDDKPAQERDYCVVIAEKIRDLSDDDRQMIEKMIEFARSRPGR